MRRYTWGGEGWQKRAERSGFALTFFGSFLGQAKKEQDKNRERLAKYGNAV